MAGVRGNPNWVKGVSGNPAGRSTGYFWNPLKKALKEKAPEILQIAVDKALAGDKEMISLLLNNCNIKLGDPIVINPADTSEKIINDTLDQFSTGDISTETVNQVTRTVETRIKAIEVKNLDERITKIEENKNA